MDVRKDKWYFGISTLVVSFLCVGPLVLPLVWINPNFSKKLKITLSVIILAVSYFLGVIFFRSLSAINNYYKLLSN